MKVIVGVDIGGTEIKVGKFNDGQLIEKKSIKTDTTDYGSRIIKDIFQVVDELLGQDTLEGIGIGVPGPVVKGIVLGAQNLGWDEIDLTSKVKNHYPHAHVAIVNDANAATFGEVAYGSAKGYHHVVMITLGTGVGGGIVIHDQLLEGFSGSAGDVGHIRVQETNPRRCSCGLFGCLEQYASATGVVKTAYELRKGKNTRLNKPNLTCKEVFDFAKEGDEVSIQVVESMTDYLASGCATIADVVNPEVIILGGGVSKAGPYLCEKVANKFKKLCFYSVRNTKFMLATLGNDAGIYGAMHAASKQ